MNEYEKQAEDFAAKIQLEVAAQYLGNECHFPNDKKTKTKRDIYRIALQRVGYGYCAPFEFIYGQSVAKSGGNKRGQRVPPTLYDILADLTKYDPGRFDDFCSEYGYDTDSRKALETYEAICEEWREVERLFGDVLDELREVQ